MGSAACPVIIGLSGRHVCITNAGASPSSRHSRWIFLRFTA
jgi:hypothetical protein